VLFGAGIDAYVRRVEEPRLEQRFGEEYAVCKRDVPRWIPRWPGGEAVSERGRARPFKCLACARRGPLNDRLRPVPGGRRKSVRPIRQVWNAR